MKSKKNKLVLIGIDGLPITLLQNYSQQEVMPQTAKLLEKGRLFTLNVPLPEISAVSWSSFMTGVDPGRHGIFGFFDFQYKSYQIYFPLFQDLQSPAFFDQLAKRDIRSVIINLPATYPARPVNGVLISGFFAPDLRRAVYPPQLYFILKQRGYQIDVDTSNARNQKPELISALNASLEIRLETALMLWQKESWDLFAFFITETDRLHHFLFKAASDQTHQFHSDFIAFYRKIDQIIGEFAARCALIGTPLLLVSDHGFEPLENEVYLNPLFRQVELLEKETLLTPEKSIIGNNSQVFALDPTRIYINSRDRFPNGAVASFQKADLKNKVRKLLTDLQVNGKHPIAEVFEAEQLYSPNPSAPDLVVLSAPGFDIKAGWQKTTIVEQTGMEGKHSHSTAFFYAGNDFPLSIQPATIMDIAGLINNYFF